MGWLSDDHEEGYNRYNNHEGHLTHDLLGGAVSYELAKAYEDHCAANGKPDSHAKAKEILAGLAGAAVTRLAETKGRDAWDSYQGNRAREHAEERLAERLADDY